MEWEGLRDQFHRLVRFLVSKYWGRGWHGYPGGREDLEQEAWIVLLSAAQVFDPERGVPLPKFVQLAVGRRLSQLRTQYFRGMNANTFYLDEDADNYRPSHEAPLDEQVAVLELLRKLPPTLGGEAMRRRLLGDDLAVVRSRITGRKPSMEWLRLMTLKAAEEAGYSPAIPPRRKEA